MNQNQRKFIDAIKPGAIDGWIQYGVLPSLTLGQAAAESGWGEHHIQHNLFGIKWTRGCGFTKAPATTKEWEGGKEVTKIEIFRGYDSFEDSIKDHNKLLGTAKRYAPLRAAKNWKEAVTQVKACGYATDPNYIKLIYAIIEQNKFYLLDDQVKKDHPRA